MLCCELSTKFTRGQKSNKEKTTCSYLENEKVRYALTSKITFTLFPCFKLLFNSFEFEKTWIDITDSKKELFPRSRPIIGSSLFPKSKSFLALCHLLSDWLFLCKTPLIFRPHCEISKDSLLLVSNKVGQQISWWLVGATVFSYVVKIFIEVL